MTAADSELAWARFRILRPFLEEGVPLTEIARQHGMALRTARRWVRRYRAGGLSALARQPRSNKGTRRALSIIQEVMEAARECLVIGTT